MISYSLYKNDGKAICKLNQLQRNTIDSLNKKILSGEYQLVDNKCICDTDDSSNDVIISEKDRYGFSIATLICGKCGLLRSAQVFDSFSNLNFYANEYRNIYVGSSTPPDTFFEDQLIRGNHLLSIWKQIVPEGVDRCVLELGCGAGGILAPFADEGMECIGYDYDQKYLDYGKAKGLDLRNGNYINHMEDNSIGLFILSHVLEHFTDPVTELLDVVRKVAEGGFVLIEVPGIFSIHKVYFDPIQYLQNAHAYSYYYAFLANLLEKIGLTVIYGDERCVCIARKPQDWVAPVEIRNSSVSYSNYPNRVKIYLILTRLLYLLKLNPFYWKHKLLSSPVVRRLVESI